MKIFPAVHYSMGGLWAGFKKDEKTGGLKSGDPANMMTNIPGLYAMGEVSFAYHGANRLGRQFAAELHLRRPLRRLVHQELLHRRRHSRRRRCSASRLRRRRQAGNRPAELAPEQRGR